MSVSVLQENLNAGRGGQKVFFDYDFNPFGALWGPERGGALFIVSINSGRWFTYFKFFQIKIREKTCFLGPGLPWVIISAASARLFTAK